MTLFYLQSSCPPLGKHRTARSNLLAKLKLLATNLLASIADRSLMRQLTDRISDGSAIGQAWWVLRDRTRNAARRWFDDRAIGRRLDEQYEDGYDYGIRSCMTWLAIYPDLECWQKCLLALHIERISGLKDLAGQVTRIMFDDPAATGQPGVTLALDAGCEPLLSVWDSNPGLREKVDRQLAEVRRRNLRPVPDSPFGPVQAGLVSTGSQA